MREKMNSSQKLLSQPIEMPKKENTYSGPRDLGLKGYRDFLTNRYGLERNEILGKYIFKRRTFDSLEEVLAAAHRQEVGGV
jgi:hypothetical protein